MTKLFALLLILTSCSGTDTNQGEDWRKYFISDDALSEGFVKKIIIQSSQGDITYYDKVFSEEDRIILLRFDNELDTLRKDVYKSDSERMTLIEATYYFDGIGAIPVEIVEPTVAPYKGTLEVLPSHFIYRPTPDIIVTFKQDAKFQKKEMYEFRGKEIECLKFSYEEESTQANSRNLSQKTTYQSKGFSLWGEDYGLIYMEFSGSRGKAVYEVEDVLTIEEFESLID